MSEWTWGRVHRTSPRHALSAAFPNLAQELNPPSVGTHGDGFTPLAGSYSAAEPYIVTSASMARYVFDTANWDNSRWVVPLGASGHPGSPHLLRSGRDMGKRCPPTHALRLGNGLPAVRDPAVTPPRDRMKYSPSGAGGVPCPGYGVLCFETCNRGAQTAMGRLNCTPSPK